MGKKAKNNPDTQVIYILNTYRNSFISTLLNFGKEIYRNYPWRCERNPYKVFISEIFLQRTKADQVVPVYEKFLQKYADLKHLVSEFDLNEISNILKPLGLEKRTKIILDIIEHYKGKKNPKIPNKYDKLINFKGIGNYIASATLCFGFGERKAILDTNVARIYMRICNIHSKTKTPKDDDFLLEFCQKMLPDENYIEFNYYLLDFGGLICTSHNPKCMECPFNKDCFYFHETKLEN